MKLALFIKNIYISKEDMNTSLSSLSKSQPNYRSKKQKNLNECNMILIGGAYDPITTQHEMRLLTMQPVGPSTKFRIPGFRSKSS